MPINSKAITFGLIEQRTGQLTGPYIAMDDSYDTLKDAMDVAEERRREHLLGIFSVDKAGNFTTVYNTVALYDAIEQQIRSRMTDDDLADERAATIADYRHDLRTGV